MKSTNPKSIILIIATTTEKAIAHQKFRTEKFGTTIETKNTSNAFIIIVNSPSVRILIGRVRNIRIGLNKALTSPSANAVTKAVIQLATVTPGSV